MVFAGGESVSEKLVGEASNLASIHPDSDGVRTEAHAKPPGCGRTVNARNPMAVGWISMSPRTIAELGALAHGWLQDRFGFCERVHASIVALAATRSMEHHALTSPDVSRLSDRAPWSDDS